MTRINCIPPKDLTGKHLLAEIRELPRITHYIKRSLTKYQSDTSLIEKDIPLNYTMGKGHVKFFYNKILFLLNRYDDLISEAQSRGFNVIGYKWEDSFIPQAWYKDWIPNEADMRINIDRIEIRLAEAREKKLSKKGS